MDVLPLQVLYFLIHLLILPGYTLELVLNLLMTLLGVIGHLFLLLLLIFGAIVDALPLDLFEQLPPVHLKVLVPEDGDLFLFSQLVKVVHVQLPDEGGEFAVLEVFREDRRFELLFVFYDEAVPVVRPADYLTDFFVLSNTHRTSRIRKVLLMKVDI